jgi:predicted deacylase
MRTWQLGSGDPDVAIVAGIHGDEPSGIEAVEEFREAVPDVQQPVQFVVANEEAAERGVRYIDEDLNRAFPGDPDAETHEGRLAVELLQVIEGRLILSLHSTQSYPEPFAIVAGLDDDERYRSITPRLPVEAVVEAGPFTEGRLISVAPTIEVECGLQRSSAAAVNASLVVDAFLRATGVLPDPDEPRTLPVFRLKDRIPKRDADEYAVHAENLSRVDAGDPIASADGEPAVAEEPFYPVLLSSNGYEEVFGYAADRIGTIGPAPETAD